MDTEDLSGDVAIASIAGYLATRAMESVSMKLYELEPAPVRQREDAVRPGPPYRIAAEKAVRLLGVKLEGTALDRAGVVLHYGLGHRLGPALRAAAPHDRPQPDGGGPDRRGGDVPHRG
jgi:hypothetical protein